MAQTAISGPYFVRRINEELEHLLKDLYFQKYYIFLLN